jgi:hypothetical protein
MKADPAKYNIEVLCNRCSRKLAIALTKRSGQFELTLRIDPCIVCESDAVENACDRVREVEFVLNESEKVTVDFSSLFVS